MDRNRFDFETLVIGLAIATPVLGFIIGIFWGIFGSEENEDAFIKCIAWIQGLIFGAILIVYLFKAIIYDDENNTVNSLSQIVINFVRIIYGLIAISICGGFIVSFLYFVIMLIPSLVSDSRSFMGLVTDIYSAWESVILNIWHWIF